MSLLTEKLAREMTHTRPIQSERPLADWLGSMNTMQKLGLLQVPVISDVAGFVGDIQQYREQPESRGLLNYGLTGMGLLPFMPNMTVFHGSPHKWLPEEGFSMGRPRLDRIGTGEGAQAYGHGMYFAESPKVAKGYAESLSAADTVERTLRDLGIGSDVPDFAVNQFASELVFQRGDMAGTMSRLRSTERLVRRDGQSAQALGYTKLLAALEGLEKQGKLPPKLGNPNLYTLDLPDERLPDLLDWDKPLSQQPEAVRKALESTKDKKIREAYEAASKVGAYSGEQGDGASLYRILSMSLDGRPVSEKATRRLQKAGIPGLRYLDAGSRGAGNGTSNFVIWDQALLDEMARRMANMASKK